MRRGLILAAALALAACGPGDAGWHAKQVTGLLPDLEFRMTAANGGAVSAADYRGKVVLLFFGYTNCPDVCPTTLARLAAARAAMRERRDAVQVLFVTVDPARDSLARLAEYVPAFGPGMAGLRGDEDAIEALTRRYRVSYTRDKPDAHGDYAVSHSGGVFVFDGKGRARLLVRPDDAAPGIAADLERLSAGG
ncbi:MAG: SCO family protein [Burkholderiales bacterium]